ncbi:MAG: class II glutamine amidotransferase [Candidatus Marinimicrobia bacterium]|nr:class II glutamine amidotransferase [Candidatus Neomarinimicrobiota bacterium]
MCRIAAYIGEGTKIENIVYNFPHNLEVQSYAPKELIAGNVNLDGFGCGWYNREVEPQPAKYATLLPLWADYNFPTIARATTSDVIFAAVRNATPPFPNELSSVQPLTLENYLFVHNGSISEYEKSRRKLENDLPDKYFNMIGNRSDSALLFAAFMWQLSELKGEGRSISTALRNTLDWLGTHLSESDRSANLNIGISDGVEAVFIRHEIGGECNSLYYNNSHKTLGGGTLVASEALDEDAGWTVVPENTMLQIKLGEKPKLSNLK